MVKEKSEGQPEPQRSFLNARIVSIVNIYSSLQLMTLFAVDLSGEENCFQFVLCVDDIVNHVSVICRKIKAVPVKNRLFFSKEHQKAFRKNLFLWGVTTGETVKANSKMGQWQLRQNSFLFQPK